MDDAIRRYKRARVELDAAKESVWSLIDELHEDGYDRTQAVTEVARRLQTEGVFDREMRLLIADYLKDIYQ